MKKRLKASPGRSPDMKQTAIPFHFMRGGTSRDPYFLRSGLPEDREVLSNLLIASAVLMPLVIGYTVWAFRRLRRDDRERSEAC